MQHHVKEAWSLPREVEPEALLSKLGKKFVIAGDPPSTREVTYCDSFDWRLFNKGYLLYCNGTDWSLVNRETGSIIEKEQGPKISKCCFPSRFRSGEFKRILDSVLEMRSVLPMASATVSTYKARVLNKDEKTVVRLYIEKQTIEGLEESVQGVQLIPVRGYRNDEEAVTSYLRRYDFLKKPLARLALEKGASVSGRSPGDYSSKFVLQLDPDQTAGSAVFSIYARLLEAMQVNIPGTLADLDSEFLHDLRVAVRRTRSGLSLIKNVLPPEVVERYKEDFAYIGTVTGPTRDLDVYLLYEAAYKSRLPDALQTGLHSFFEDLAVERKAAQSRLVRELKGEKIKGILASWGDFLESEADNQAKNAGMPVVDLAGKIIYRRYKRVMRDGLAIHDQTPDAEIHGLRIQGKKLRYAIEFFSSLFPETEVKSALKRLKKLQNYLGDFNDLSVQQDMLFTHLQNLRPGSRRNLELGAALGGLMTYLHQEQLKARKEFGEVFGRFSGTENVALFERLFK